MKVSPKGVFSVLGCGAFAIGLWVIGYFTLPNNVTHRNLAANPPVQSSVVQDTGDASGGGTSSQAPAQTAPFYALGKTEKTLNLDLNSGSSQANQGLNFNGFAKGELVVTIPVGWKVSITYKNVDAQMPHSIGVVPWTQRNGMGNFTPAFAGAIPTANFANGITKSGTPMSISFTADKAGQYAMICGVPGHAMGGMWDELDVSSSVKAPTIKTPSGTQTVSAS